MTMKLFLEALAKFVLGFVLVCLLIFLPAGTFLFKNGWVLIIILFVPMFIAGVVLMFKNPELLKKRLKGKEKQKKQNFMIKLCGLMFCTGFVVAGLGFRLNWYMVPNSVVIIAVVVFVAAYIIYAEVMRENVYLSRTIEVEVSQKVVNTGLYSVVRHPMYSATLFLFLAFPLVLGSLYSFIIFLVYPFIIVNRIKEEEVFLEKELSGYAEYKQMVKYRLIPFVW